MSSLIARSNCRWRFRRVRTRTVRAALRVEHRLDERLALVVRAVELDREVGEAVGSLGIRVEVDLQTLVHPLRPGVEECLSRREMAVDRSQRDAGAAGDQGDGHLLARRICDDLRDRMEDAQPGLLHLLGPKWALVRSRLFHSMTTILQYNHAVKNSRGRVSKTRTTYESELPAKVDSLQRSVPRGPSCPYVDFRIDATMRG